MDNLEQRLAYLKKLLSESNLSDYGFTNEELLQLIAMPTATVLELLIHLKCIKMIL